MPNREELAFRDVLAFPNASRTGLVARIAASRAANSSPAAAAAEAEEEEEEEEAAAEEASAATCLSASLADSVFPAPLSPLMMMDWDRPEETMAE